MGMLNHSLYKTIGGVVAKANHWWAVVSGVKADTDATPSLLRVWDDGGLKTGKIARVSAQISVPAGSTDYVATAVVTAGTTGFDFSGAAEYAGQAGIIRSAAIMSDMVMGTAGWRVKFSTTPRNTDDGTVEADSYTDLYARDQGHIDFSTPAAAGTTVYVDYQDNLCIPFVTSGTTSLYGIVRTDGVFTRVTAQKIGVILGITYL